MKIQLPTKIQSLMRGAFYALTITLGIFTALLELDKGRVDSYLKISAIIYGIFVIELYTSWSLRSTRQKLNLDRFSPVTQFLHHFIVPFLTYLGFIGFIYFNHAANIRALTLVGCFVILVVLFTNIRAFYEHSHKLESQTNYIYDITKLIIFFTLSDTFLNLSLNLTLSLYGGVLLSAITLFALLILTGIRYHKLEVATFQLSAFLSICLILVLGFLVFLNFLNVLELSVYTLIGGYLSIAILHHSINKTLTPKIALEYLLMLILAVVLLYGLN